jgi:hypothetical protein
VAMSDVRPLKAQQGRPVELVTPQTLSVLDQPGAPIRVGVSYQNDVSAPLRTLALKPPQVPVRQEAEENPKLPHSHVDQPDAVMQTSHLAAPGAAMPATTLDFDGLSVPVASCNCAPPDTNGEAGLTQYMQTVNLAMQVFDKSTGATVLAPTPLATVWVGFGGVCETNGDGDPVAFYDQIANRWVISQFAGASAATDECIAVSTSADATGTYYRYGFHLGANFYDYPKFGLWPDAYYMSMNVFNSAGTAFLGPQPFAFDRAAMIAGGVATFVTTGITVGPAEPTYLPADMDGSILPDAGAPETFLEFPETGIYKVWHFHADFATPANTTFTLFSSPAAAAFTELCPSTRACVPEPGGQAVDGIGDRLMYRLAYRRFADHEAIVGNFSVNAAGVAGIRWFEFRGVTAGPVTLYQEGTYAPDATDWRWMGSAALDQSGNMAIGFSASSANVNPQLRYAGRLVTDQLNTLAQGEAHLYDGTGAQSSSGNRWGDYSALTIDPVDDCTFWFTSEYYATNSSYNWKTRVGKFKFPTCGGGANVVLSANGASFGSEGCFTNSAADPGERLTVNLGLINNGTASTTSLVGTLLNTGGVFAVLAAQNYGAIAGGATATRPFTFTAGAFCGKFITASLQLQDGGTNYGTVTYTIPTGTTSTSVSNTEPFDGVVAPALPAGWSSTASGAETPWVTSTSVPSTANNAFAPDPATVGITDLVSAPFAVPIGGAVLSFANYYNTEYNTGSPTIGYDGMVLEISVNGAPFTDITAGGNAFISNGYNRTISTGFSSPLGGRAAWSGDSGGYVTSAIELPLNARGRTIQLRWRMASDSSVAKTGVRIDTVMTSRSTTSCASCGTSAFTDQPLAVGVTGLKGIHVTELRNRIDAQRARFGLGGYSWTPVSLSPPGTVTITALQVNEMRTALGQAYTAYGLTVPVFTDTITTTTPIRALYIMELRDAVVILERL